jgi:hypothetical protein
MSKKTIEVIVNVATEVFYWAISILRDKYGNRKGETHDRDRNSKKK